MRYGLHRQDGQGMTLGDLSAAYGLTKERIRQLEESALHKLRRHKDVLTAHLEMSGTVRARSAPDSDVSMPKWCLNN
jgi:formamidopyrimidine-DNA glycosylase